MVRQNPIAKQIVLTEPDFDRLRALVDSPQFRSTHGRLLSSVRDELDRAQVVSADRVPKAVVTMRSTVQVRDMETDEVDTWTVVYPEEADIDENRLSVLAPLGKALLGAKKGQVVRFEAPGGQRRLKVEKILYQPEAAGDFHL